MGMMAIRRRTSTTPFEVMGRQIEPTTPGQEPDQSAGSKPSQPREQDPEIVAPGEALLIRAPKGLVAIVVGLILALVILTYWVGYQQGGGPVEDPAAVIMPSQIPPGPILRDSPSVAFIGAELSGPEVSVLNPQMTPFAGHDAESAEDPRREGFNYLILATYPPREAERLAEFLAENRVATVLNPVNNAGLQVIAVNAGFSRDAFEEGVPQAYRAALLEVGRLWHEHNGRRGNDALQDMYFYRHGPGD